MMGPIAGASSAENDHRRNRSGGDVALLRPFLATVLVGLYTWEQVRFYDSSAPPAVAGWEGRVPYFSRWEVYLPWLCLTAALAAYLAGALAVRLFGKPVVALSVVAFAALALSFPLRETVQMQNRDYAENYNTCHQINENTYGCGGGTKVTVSGELSEAELQAILRTAPPPYPYPRRGFFVVVSLGLVIFSGAPRLPRGSLARYIRPEREATGEAPG